ncbi:Mur ligase [Kalaharituber pfeilii]|nr:Mur ligase [Kalaharituber pfeilii]
MSTSSLSAATAPVKESDPQNAFPRTRPRTYTDAINALNTLQPNADYVAQLARSLETACPNLQMCGWVRRVGYSPSDFDALNIVHVAGTKGKGSTCAFTSRILQEYAPLILPPGRQKIGLYTSPHLCNVRERIRIDGTPLSEDLFAKYFFEVWDKLQETKPQLPPETDAKARLGDPQETMMPMYFRYMTLMAWHVFLEENVGMVVMEVGVGGEYDATNVVERPVATGITLLDIDHVHLLGDIVERIAWHKAGIMKKGVRCFSGSQVEGAKAVLAERAQEKGAELIWVPNWNELKGEVELGLQGGFQWANASLAMELAREAVRKVSGGKIEIGFDGGVPKEMVRALKETRWPGRCQVLRDKVKSNVEWCLDGAHTIESMKVAGRWFVKREWKSDEKVQDEKRRKRVLIFNQQDRARDAKKLLKVLHGILMLARETQHIPSSISSLLTGAEARVEEEPLFHHAIFTTNITCRNNSVKPDLVYNKHGPDTLEIQELTVQRELENEWRVLENGVPTSLSRSVEEAVEVARGLAGEGEELVVLVTGSLRLVGGVLVVLEWNEEEEEEEEEEEQVVVVGKA